MNTTIANTINPAQLKCLSTLVSQLKIGKEDKKVMVLGFSGGRSESSKDLMSNEAADMIKHLKSLDPLEKSADKMRKKIIAMAHEMGWSSLTPNPSPNGEGRKTAKVDMKRIDDWCKKQFGKKQLNNYTYKELTTLVAVFEKVYKDYLNKF